MRSGLLSRLGLILLSGSRKCLEFGVDGSDEKMNFVGNSLYGLALGNLALAFHFSQEYEEAIHFYKKVCL